MNERQERIYQVIQKLGNATIEHLTKEIYASPATIRRDLAKMEAEGVVSRVWGGAILAHKNTLDPPDFVRSNENISAKKKIARKALSMLFENCSIFIPAGTTVKELCKIFGELKNLTVITNCVDVINTLRDFTSFKLYSIGGELHENHDFVGPIANEFIDKFSSNFLFFSCSGITKDGFTSNDIQRLDIITHMQKNSTKTVLLCDTSKINKKCMYNGFDFSKIDYVIMEKMPNDKELVSILKDKIIIA